MKIKKLQLTLDDRLKLQRHNGGFTRIDQEWLLLAEFGRAYGWEAYKAAKNDEISLMEMMTLIEASRKLDALQHYKNAEAAFIGAGSAQTKKPSSTFRTLTKDILKKIRID